jgi:PAS domain S-box-containing protein
MSGGVFDTALLTQLQAIVSLGKPVSFCLDREGIFQLSEGRSLESLGLKPGQVVGLSALELYKDHPSIVAGIRQALEGEIFHGVVELAGLVFDFFMSPHRDESGEIQGVVGMAIDISESARATGELRESEARYRDLLESTHDIVQSVDPDGAFLFVNRTWMEVFGYTKAEAKEITLWELIHPDSVGHCQWLFGQILQGNMPIEIEATFVAKDGRQVLVEGAATGRQLNGELIATHAFLSDVTEKRRAEREREQLVAELHQAQKMEALGQLTGGVAHDFNNLLTAIIGNVELLRGDIKGNESALHMAGQALDAAQRAATLTQRLLAFSRRQALEPSDVAVHALVRGMEELLQRTLGETIQISTNTEDELWACSVDPAQLEHVILNLSINARDAMPDGGELRIETSNQHLDTHYAVLHKEVVPGDYVLLSVSDDGEGMAAAVIAHAFEPFFTTKEVGKGSGLGLSMVYGFVKQSGGHVRIYSEPGHGTKVKIYLPRGGPVAKHAKMAEPALDNPPGAGQPILVVEDETIVRDLSVNLLELLGYSVLEAGDATMALTVLDENPDIALLFTDVVLAGSMSGVELATEAKKRRKSLRVLFTSGYTESTVLRFGQIEGSVDLLSKPFTVSALAQKIHEVLHADT